MIERMMEAFREMAWDYGEQERVSLVFVGENGDL